MDWRSFWMGVAALWVLEALFIVLVFWRLTREAPTRSTGEEPTQRLRTPRILRRRPSPARPGTIEGMTRDVSGLDRLRGAGL